MLASFTHPSVEKYYHIEWFVSINSIQPRQAMASHLPIPAPPRTPTPPPDDGQPTGDQLYGLGLEEYLASPAQSNFDPNSLSPMDENYQSGRRYGASARALTTNPLGLSPMTDSSSLHSTVSIESSSGSQPNTGALVEKTDGKGMFNFQPTSLAKSPVSKSVCFPSTPGNHLPG